MQATRSFFYGIRESINLAEVIKIPENLKDGLYKCRVSYDKAIRNIGFSPYKLKENSKILLLEIGKSKDYSFKFEDRVFFKNALEENPDVDDVLFLSNDYVTDCTYTNIILYDGKQWITPDTQLLNGVKRQYYIDNNFLSVRKVKVQDLLKYEKIAFINSMRDFERVYEFEVVGNKILLNLSTT